MKRYSHKRPRQSPISPEKEKPFFSQTAARSPFFSGSNNTTVQPKLTVGKPNDAFEQEADAVAEAIANSPQTTPMQSRAESQIHRQAAEEEEPAQAKPELMRMEKQEEPVQAKSEPGHQTPSDLSQRLDRTKGQGRPLPAPIQKKMARAFDYDFSDVTIHTGSEAVQMTRELKAQAFTRGQDIYFNEGKYNPESSSGEKLLLHELAHVVQQNPPGFKTRG